MAYGEIEQVVLNLSQTFIHDQNKFIRPYIAYLRSEKLTDKYLDQFAEDDIPIYDLGYNGFPYVEVFSNLKKLIEQESIEIVHVHSPLALFFVVTVQKALSFDFKIINSIHNNKGISSSVSRLQERALAWAVDHNVYSSRGIKQQYIDVGLESVNSSVVRNGVSIESSSLTNELAIHEMKKILIDQYFAEFPLKTKLLEKKWIVSLGPKVPEKGQDRLLKLWRRLSPSVHKEFLLFLVGPSPEYSSELSRLAPGDQTAFVVDYLGAYKDWIVASHLLVQLSRSEGFTSIPFEALCHLRPVLLSNIAAHEEFSEFATILKNHKDVSSFQVWIENKKTQTSREQLFAQFKTLKKSFSRSRMANEYLALYKRLLNF